MPSLAHLKIGKAPAAFAEFAQKHNEVVSLIESIEAATGLDIKITHTPAKKLKVGSTPDKQSMRSKGRIRIGLKSGSILGQVGSTFGAGGGGSNVANTLLYNDGTTAISIDGTNGVYVSQIGVNSAKLTKTGQIISSDGSNTVAISPTVLTVNATGISPYTSTVTPLGLSVASVSSGTAQFYPTGISVIGSNGTGFNADKTSITLNGGPGGSLQIDRSNITHNMTIKTITVCNGNTSMSMLVIASDPF